MKNLEYVTVPDYLVKNGEEALLNLLPRESKTKFTDLALLSLIYPFDVVSERNKKEILRSLEYHLERDRGIIRYKNDRYYNKNDDGYSEEAEWCFGFPWLAIIYGEMGETDKAHEYLEKSKSIIYNGQIPELYYSDSNKPNDNIPLGWAESLFVVALLRAGR
jgi:phosphorylase kinase alpha/beta subunit